MEKKKKVDLKKIEIITISSIVAILLLVGIALGLVTYYTSVEGEGYGIHKRGECSVVFYANYPGTEEDIYYQTTVKKGKLTSRMPNPPKSNYYYKFMGWYKDPGCSPGMEFDMNNEHINVSMPLYAKWERTKLE